MHKVFISYHHENDQRYKEDLLKMRDRSDLFVDKSVNAGEISDDWSPETIRKEIRDEYLRDSTVTILLCGEETRHRKHIDWELKTSMIDGQKNGKSGILVITLPSISSRNWCRVSQDAEKQVIYPGVIDWTSLDSWSAYREKFPHLPERIIDNLANTKVKISVCPWERIEGYPGNLKWLIDAAFVSRETNEYDLERPMRKHDRNPAA